MPNFIDTILPIGGKIYGKDKNNNPGFFEDMGPFKRTTPVKVATFGDSTADVGTIAATAVTDFSQCIPVWQAGNKSYTMTGEKFGLHMHYPQTHLVANGGVSGDSTSFMLARSANAYSATRRALEDIIRYNPDVVLLRGGSINDLLSVTSGNRATVVAATYANHIKIIDCLLSYGIPVIDSGIYGYNGVGATDLAQTRQAIAELNALYYSYAVAHPKQVYFLDFTGVLSDGAGTLVSTVHGDGTHLNTYGQYLAAAKEAEIVKMLFGPANGCRYPGFNLIKNSLFTQTGSQSYGTVATGFAVYNAANSTTSNAKVETLSGKRYQTVEVVCSGGASHWAQMRIPFDPTAAATGMVQALDIQSGDVYGFEFDWYLKILSGDTSKIRLNGIVNIVDSVDSGNISIDALVGAYSNFPVGEYFGHCVLPPIKINEVTANMTTGSNFYFSVNDQVADLAYKFGVCNPRIVKLGQAITTI